MKLFTIICLISFTSMVNSQTTSMTNGSGIVLTADGLIATNYHVVEDGLEFFVDVFTNGEKKKL